MSDDGRADLSDDELRGYMNDVVLITSGFLFTILCAVLVVEFVLGPLLAPVMPAFSGSIVDCVWTGTESVCSGGLGARSVLVVAVGVVFSVAWLNSYQNRIRPALAARGVVPDDG